jgi:hypothetical protein
VLLLLAGRPSPSLHRRAALLLPPSLPPHASVVRPSPHLAPPVARERLGRQGGKSRRTLPLIWLGSFAAPLAFAPRLDDVIFPLPPLPTSMSPLLGLRLSWPAPSLLSPPPRFPLSDLSRGEGAPNGWCRSLGHGQRGNLWGSEGSKLLLLRGHWPTDGSHCFPPPGVVRKESVAPCLASLAGSGWPSPVGVGVG